MEPPIWKQPGATFDVAMTWKLPDGARLWATVIVEVETVSEEMMRLAGRITLLKSLRASVAPEQLDERWIEKVQALIGQYVRVPFEAATGTSLNLRLETLTGEHHFFSDEPRT